MKKRKRSISNFDEVVGELKHQTIMKLRFMFPELRKAKKRGEHYYIKCPFHRETHPSLSIFHNDVFRIGFTCFGCHEAGTVIDYYMKRTGYSFKRSLIDLCKIYKIKIEWRNT